MKRRTLLQSLAAALFVRPSASVAAADPGADDAHGQRRSTTLRALAEVVLPDFGG